MHIKASLVYSCYGPAEIAFFFWSLLEHGKRFTQVSAEKGHMVAHLVPEISASGLERKKGDTELNITF